MILLKSLYSFSLPKASLSLLSLRTLNSTQIIISAALYKKHFVFAASRCVGNAAVG